MKFRKILRRKKVKKPATVGELMLALENNLEGIVEPKRLREGTHLEPLVVKLYRKELESLLGNRVVVACDGINVYVGGEFVKDIYTELNGVRIIKINKKSYRILDQSALKNHEAQDLLYLLDDLWDDCVEEAHRLYRQSKALKLLIDKQGYKKIKSFENFEQYSNGSHRFLYNRDNRKIIWLKPTAQ